jgi:hypothetical protein
MLIVLAMAVACYVEAIIALKSEDMSVVVVTSIFSVAFYLFAGYAVIKGVRLLDEKYITIVLPFMAMLILALALILIIVPENLSKFSSILVTMIGLLLIYKSFLLLRAADKQYLRTLIKQYNP